MIQPLDESLDDRYLAPPSIWPTILKFGLIGVAITIVLDLISFNLGENGSSNFDYSFIIMLIPSILLFLLYITLMVLATKSYRDNYAGGRLSLGRGMIIAYLTGCVVAFSGLLFRIIYLTVIDPEYMNRITQNQMDNVGISNIDFSLSFWEILLTQISGAVLGLIVGALLALIVAAIMQRHPPRSMDQPNNNI